MRRQYKTGQDHKGYKHGNSCRNTIYYCIEANCNNKVSRNNKRCLFCRTKKRIHEATCQCCICKARRGETKGNNNPMYSKKLPESAKLKLSELNTGKSHPRWKGGLSREPYPLQFNNRLKELIRKRDNYKCQLCNYKQNDRKLDVHHIDYNKSNCEEENLITLCGSCNIKINSNRKEWQTYFSNVKQAA